MEAESRREVAAATSYSAHLSPFATKRTDSGTGSSKEEFWTWGASERKRCRFWLQPQSRGSKAFTSWDPRPTTEESRSTQSGQASFLRQVDLLLSNAPPPQPCPHVTSKERREKHRGRAGQRSSTREKKRSTRPVGSSWILRLRFRRLPGEEGRPKEPCLVTGVSMAGRKWSEFNKAWAADSPDPPALVKVNGA